VHRFSPLLINDQKFNSSLKKGTYTAEGTKVSHSPPGHLDLLLMEVRENSVGIKVAMTMRIQN